MEPRSFMSSYSSLKAPTVHYAPRNGAFHFWTRCEWHAFPKVTPKECTVPEGSVLRGEPRDHRAYDLGSHACAESPHRVMG